MLLLLFLSADYACFLVIKKLFDSVLYGNVYFNFRKFNYNDQTSKLTYVSNLLEEHINISKVYDSPTRLRGNA